MSLAVMVKRGRNPHFPLYGYFLPIISTFNGNGVDVKGDYQLFIVPYDLCRRADLSICGS